ncbi:hypothetical protein PLICRDRAFT_175951 [Plicaturopsis crispa FD-325 SS-3]|nr:hypothetical protein PLICRDRAFT_175951 [Plicaturopsis crispa FD-325 SS-3]
MLLTWTILTLSGFAYGARTHGLTTDPKSFSSQSYHYLVVGGGNAGLVVAARLSENPAWNVGVIEAGPYYTDEPFVNTPFLNGAAVNQTKFDWSLTTVPQPNVDNRGIGTSIGKMLGGSSGLNFMTYGRASSAEYDAWATLGNSNWTWNSLLPYFKKSEDVTPGESGIFPEGTTKRSAHFKARASGPPGNDPAFQGKSGPLKIGFNTKATFTTDLLYPYAQSFVNAGSFVNDDPDSGNGTGIFQSARSVDPAINQRSYSASAFFAPNQHRQNLLVLTGAQATKVFTSKRNGSVVATGVQMSAGGTTYAVNATKEVILSAGAIKTPQLLELSGIGDSSILQRYNISTVIDLPAVGTNLQDHMLMGSDFLLKEPAPLTWDIIRNNASYNASSVKQYATTHEGVYASTNAVIAVQPLQQIANASEVSSILSTLDQEIAKANVTGLQKAQYTIQRQMLVDGSIGQLETAMAPTGGKSGTNVPILAGRSYITIVSIGARPFSRGSVHINTADPFASPTIDPRYFDFSFDSEILKLGLKHARKVAQTEPLASMIDRPNSPPASVTTDEDYLKWLKQFTTSVYHPVGTAPLAPKDMGGVVDQSLRVYGTSNLRVVDGSVIPQLFAAHTQSTIYAIAEKASDIIKAEN